MERIATDKAPAAVGPYAQAVKSGGLLFCSGQIGIDPRTGKLAGEDIETQAGQVLENMQKVLLAAGLGMKDVLKTTVFLVDMKEFPVVNAVYAEVFGDHRPARSTVQVAGLPLGARIEIECIADAGLGECQAG